MEVKHFEEEKSFNYNNKQSINEKKIYFHLYKLQILVLSIFFFTLLNLIILFRNNYYKDDLNKNKIQKFITDKKEKLLQNKNANYVTKDLMPTLLSNEINRIYLKNINKKRTFENRFPLPKELDCKSHMTKNEIVGFLSFFTKNTIFFETGSGCSSIYAKYYAKKSYAVEGSKYWYEIGIKNGLKDNLIFHDLKPDNHHYCYPGKLSTLDDWKKYFQAYDSSYNADVILIDGRFKVATAMDIFDKIKEDTIVLIHEFQERPIYFILEKYYQYVYHWDRLTAFIKKNGINSIPIDIQKQYWNKESAF